MNDKVIEALEQNQFIELLRGEYPLNDEIYSNSINVLPVNIEQVITEIYKEFIINNSVRARFIEAIEIMLTNSPEDFYLAWQYIEICLFRESISRATFFIEIENLLSKMKKGYYEFENELLKEIIFSNGLVKKQPLKNILSSNQFFIKKYGFSVL